MRAIVRLNCGGLAAVLAFLLSAAPHTFAQSTTNDPIPIVTIRATDPYAKESGKTATFEVDRHGPTNLTLNVYYSIGGSASNGVDYAALSQWAVIPAGSNAATITIKPIPDSGTESNEEGTRTVILTLTPSPLMIPVNYEIGSPNSAIAYIFDDDATANLPPVVNIFSPTNGSTFYTPVNIQILATAFDVDGVVTNVEFFAGSLDLGKGNPLVLDPPGVNGIVGLVYFLTWNNPLPGTYPLTAVATDNGGASTTSSPVNISVLPGPPPTNIPPVVRIISPPNGSTFRAPVNITIFAYANDADGTVASVEFFANKASIGFGTPIPGPTPAAMTNIFFLVWSNATTGIDVLTAQATDNGGASTMSAPATVTVLPPLPPPTNRPPIVSIIAKDPIAVEGTNCWAWLGMTNVSPTWSQWATAICIPITNCGPKNATFAVRRWGDTNDDLMVPYAIGGTASNGVDYVSLPGMVTIPAGERLGWVTIVPIDDGPPDVDKTVVLKLIPSTNTPPDYLVGFPPAAAALIIDSNCPRPGSGMLGSDCFHLNASGPDGAWFRVECSTNLGDWSPVCTNQVVQGSIDFIDPDVSNHSLRFYRAMPELNAPLLP